METAVATWRAVCRQLLESLPRLPPPSSAAHGRVAPVGTLAGRTGPIPQTYLDMLTVKIKAHIPCI